MSVVVALVSEIASITSSNQEEGVDMLATDLLETVQ